VTPVGAIVLEAADLERTGSSLAFVGDEHGGGVGASFFLFDAPAGRGPDLHRHDYAEIFIVQEGQAAFTVGERELIVRAGQVVVVPAGVPHGFKSMGDEADVGAEPVRDGLHVGGRDAPGHQAAGALGDRRAEDAPERRALRLGGVRHGHQLEVAAAERDDPVVRPDALVAPAAGGDEPVLGLQARRRIVEVRRGEDHVVEDHRGIVHPAA
jgi:quercetin dioxygenase-like cupin family protein